MEMIPYRRTALKCAYHPALAKANMMRFIAVCGVTLQVMASSALAEDKKDIYLKAVRVFAACSLRVLMLSVGRKAKTLRS